MERIGNIIRKKRKSLGLSMEKVAQKTDMTYKTVLAIEQGKPATMTTLFAILDVLGLEFIIRDKEVEGS
jgi:transcriptional regulator with XRE-family HTH domain